MKGAFFLLFAMIFMVKRSASKFGVTTAKKHNILWRACLADPSCIGPIRARVEEQKKREQDDSNFIVARTVAKATGEITDALDKIIDFTGKDKADLVAVAGTRKTAGTKLSSFAKLTKALSIFRHIEGVGILVDLFTGDSVASQRHSELLNEFRKQDQKLERLSKELEFQTNRVITEIWNSHFKDLLDDLETVSENYRDYIEKPVKQFEDMIVRAYENGKIADSVYGIKSAIQDRAEALYKSSGDCSTIVDLKSEISIKLIRPYQAYRLGCELAAKKHGEPEYDISGICNQNSLPDVQTIYDQLDRPTRECRSVKNVKKIVKSFIEREIEGDDSTTEARDKINDFLEERFSYMTWVVIVYKPHWGFGEHTTNFDIRYFRYQGSDMNIAVDIMEPCTNHPNCAPATRDCLTGNDFNFNNGRYDARRWYEATNNRLNEQAKIIAFKRDGESKYAFKGNGNGICDFLMTQPPPRYVQDRSIRILYMYHV